MDGLLGIEALLDTAQSYEYTPLGKLKVQKYPISLLLIFYVRQHGQFYRMQSAITHAWAPMAFCREANRIKPVAAMPILSIEESRQ